MKKRVINYLLRRFPVGCLIADLHQFFLLTAVGGMVAYLFSGTAFSPWLLIGIVGLLILGVVIGSREE